MKKLYIILTVLILSIININVYSAECAVLESDFTVEDVETGTVIITKYNGSCNDVIVPKTIDGNQVVSIGENAFSSDTITSVEIMYNVDIYDSENTFNSSILLKGLKDSNIIEYANKYGRDNKIIYTVNYDINDYPTIYVEDNEYTIDVENPKKDYYTFLYWSDGTNVYNKESILTVNDNVYLTSMFKPNYYKVKFNANGGTGKMSSVSYITNTNYKLPKVAFTRKNYKFYGWNTASDGSGDYYKNTATVNNLVEQNKGTITLYAIWSKKYSITFDSNGGNKISTKSVYYNFKIGTLTTPKRKGYKFLGWYTDKDVLVDSTTIYNYKKNIKLYAKWQKIKYTITYSLKGENNPSNITKYSVTTSFKLLSPTRKGYIFKGWYKDSKLKSKITKISKGTTGNKTYYAAWTPIKYNVVFYANGGTGSMSKMTNIKYNTTVTLTKNKFKKSGYKFMGWNTAADGSGTAYTNAQSIKNLTSVNGKNIKLYAQWKIVEYTITYNYGDDNTYELNNPTTYTVNDTIKFVNPEKEGYLFIGWYTTNKYENKVVKIKKGTTGNKTYYGKWVRYDPAAGITKERIYMVETAISQLGNYNGEKYWRWYGRSKWMHWCCAFISWVANENGYLNKSIPKFAGTDTGYSYFKKKGQFKKKGKYTPLPGDVIFFDWKADGGINHVGFVEKTDGTYVYTIEGNSSNRVKRNKYKLNDKEIYGYGVPDYSKK